jgi:hypothetical protein
MSRVSQVHRLVDRRGSGSHSRRFCMPWAFPDGRDQPTITADSAVIVATYATLKAELLAFTPHPLSPLPYFPSYIRLKAFRISFFS